MPNFHSIGPVVIQLFCFFVLKLKSYMQIHLIKGNEGNEVDEIDEMDKMDEVNERD